MPVYWYDALALNVEEIDSQHKRIIDMYNALEQAIASRRGVTHLARLTDEMIAYAREHFKTEEELMSRYAYPQFEGHAAEHEAFIDKTMGLAFSPDDDQNSPVKMLEFLKNWIIEHILGTDKPLGFYLNGRGVS